MKVAIYVRVSTNRQTQAQTIDQQLERLRRHLESRGESLAADHIFRDDGLSGANLNRPGLDRLRDRVKGGALDRVLLTSPDRLARNYVHQMVLIEEWERCGCKVEFLDRPMSQDPHDQLLLQIRGVAAEYERVLIAERMRRGRQMKLKGWSVIAMDGAAVRIPICPGSSPRSLWRTNRTSRRRNRAGVVRTVFAGTRYAAELNQAPAAPRPSFASGKSALECGVDSRLADQSGLHGQAVYWTEPISAGPHSTVCHPSVGQPGTRAGSYPGRGVEPDRSRAGSGEPG